MSNNNKVKLKEVRKLDYQFLYQLLSERLPHVNISHKKMPSYEEHIKFASSKLYTVWYIIYFGDEKIGSIYLSRQNEIGIHMKKKYDKLHIKEKIVKLLINRHPRKRYLVNINPKNKKAIIFFKKQGFKLVQFTYELIR